MTSPWTEELKTLVVELWPTHSASEIAEKLPYGFTRNSVVGKLHRLGLTSKDKTQHHPSYRHRPGIRKPKPENKPVFRFIRANGNSTALRIHQSIQTEPFKLHCVELRSRDLTTSEIDLAAECQWIAGSDHLHCGHPIVAGTPYCHAHAAIAYRAPEPRRPKAWRAVA